MHRFFVVVLAAFVLSTSFGQSGASAAEPHVLSFSDGLDVGTLNPLLATSANVTFLGQLTMAHFVRVGPHNELVPELITELPSTRNGGISADGRSITYHLRRGVRWSDGVPFDADDVVYTVHAIQDRDNAISQRDAWDRVSGVSAPNKNTVVLRLKSRFAPFASRFFASLDTSCILPKHILGAQTKFDRAAYNALPVGIGPFRYTAWRRGDAVEMEANPFYFRGAPKLHKIVYKIITDENTLFTQLQTGELGLWATVGGTFVDRVRQVSGVRTVVLPSQFISAIYLNTQQPAVRDRDVRQALRMATDRAFVIRAIVHSAGTAAESVVPSIAQDADTSMVPTAYDPAGAERLLDRAGWSRGSDGMRSKAGTTLAITLALPSGYAPSATAAELVRAAWGKLGVGVEVKPYGSEQFFGPAATGGILMGGKFDAALLSVPGDYLADETPYYGCRYAPPHGFNVTRYCNRAVDKMMDAYVGSYDDRQRAGLARRIQRAIDADAPAIVLYERSFAYAFTTRLTGFSPNGFTAFDDFLGVDIAP